MKGELPKRICLQRIDWELVHLPMSAREPVVVQSREKPIERGRAVVPGTRLTTKAVKVSQEERKQQYNTGSRMPTDSMVNWEDATSPPEMIPPQQTLTLSPTPNPRSPGNKLSHSLNPTMPDLQGPTELAVMRGSVIEEDDLSNPTL